MMTHAYNQLYLDKAARAIGNMLHDAVVEFGLDGTDFLERFIQSDVAEYFEDGSPKYIAGKSGIELFVEVMEKTTGENYEVSVIESYDRSPVYWVGWMLTQYQWYSGYSFKNILNVIPYDEILGLYPILHEADISKSYDIMDAHFEKYGSKLKMLRKRCGITQETLSNVSGVSLNTIKAYECKNKDLSKAQFGTVIKLANALKCDIYELYG